MNFVIWKGFRLIASSLLPLGKDSLIYGSNDAGLTVHRDNADFNEMIDNASKRLNLRPHLCGTGKNPVLMASAIDLEGHKGKDGRFYLLDFSRVFPCEKPSPKYLCGHLYRMLRPEFVNTYGTPLCSDSYSNFLYNKEEANQCNHDVDVATNNLRTITLTFFANQLVQQLETELKGTKKNFECKSF